MKKTKVCRVGPLSIHMHRWMEAFSLRGYDLSVITDCKAWVAPNLRFPRVPFIDTTSVSLLEAMACGLPPIVTDIAGNREWIKDGVNGLLFPPENSIALSEKIIQLIKNEDTRRHFSERCLQIVKQKTSWESCVNKMEAIYQSLL